MFLSFSRKRSLGKRAARGRSFQAEKTRAKNAQVQALRPRHDVTSLKGTNRPQACLLAPVASRPSAAANASRLANRHMHALRQAIADSTCARSPFLRVGGAPAASPRRGTTVVQCRDRVPPERSSVSQVSNLGVRGVGLTRTHLHGPGCAVAHLPGICAAVVARAPRVAQMR